MLKKDDVTIDGNNIKIHKELNAYSLGKIEEALNSMEEKREWKGNVEFEWSELQFIRRLVIADEVSTAMAGYNLSQSRDRRKRESETE